MYIDGETLFKIAGIGLAVAFLYTVLEQAGKKDYAQWLAFFGAIYVLYIVIQALGDFFEAVRSILMFYD